MLGDPTYKQSHITNSVPARAPIRKRVEKRCHLNQAPVAPVISLLHPLASLESTPQEEQKEGNVIYVGQSMHAGFFQIPKFFPPVESRIVRCTSFMSRPLNLAFSYFSGKRHIYMFAQTDEVGQRPAVLSSGACQGQKHYNIKFALSQRSEDITGQMRTGTRDPRCLPV